MHLGRKISGQVVCMKRPREAHILDASPADVLGTIDGFQRHVVAYQARFRAFQRLNRHRQCTPRPPCAGKQASLIRFDRFRTSGLCRKVKLRHLAFHLASNPFWLPTSTSPKPKTCSRSQIWNRMMSAGFPSFFGLRLQDGHVPTFWLLLQSVSCLAQEASFLRARAWVQEALNQRQQSPVQAVNSS